MSQNSETLKESIRVLAQALKCTIGPKRVVRINETLGNITSILESSFGCQDAARLGEVSCILAFALKYRLVDAYFDCVQNSTTEIAQNFLHLSADTFADLFFTILREAPDGKALSAFVCLLAGKPYAEIAGQALLPLVTKLGVQALFLMGPQMHRIVQLCYSVCLYATEESLHPVEAIDCQSFSMQELNKNFLLCIFCFTKLLLHSHLVHMIDSPDSLHGRTSKSAQRKRTEESDLHSRQEVLKQHIFQLHRLLLQAVRMLEQTFWPIEAWQTVRDFLLEEDLWRTNMPTHDLGTETSSEMWEPIVDVLKLLLEMLRLQQSPHPLEEVVISMAVEVMAAMGVSSMFEQRHMISLGLQVMKTLKKTPYNAARASLTVRMLFAVQLGLETLSLMCQLGDGEYIKGSLAGKAWAMLQPRDRRQPLSTEAQQKKAEVLSAAELLYLDWMLVLEKVVIETLLSKAVKEEAVRAMQEGGLEALLERMIRWLSSVHGRYIPTKKRLRYLRTSVRVLIALIEHSQGICVSNNLSICTTLKKVAPVCVAEFHNTLDPESKLESFAVLQTFCCVYLKWIKVGISNPSLSTVIGAWDPSSTLSPGGRGADSALGPEPGVIASRYKLTTELSASESATLIHCSLPVLIQVLSDIVERESISASMVQYWFDIPILLIEVLQDLNRAHSWEKARWFASAMLESPFVPLLKKMYITLPQEVNLFIPFWKFAGLDHLFYTINGLFVATYHTESTGKCFAKAIVHQGLLDGLFHSVKSMKPDLETSPDAKTSTNVATPGASPHPHASTSAATLSTPSDLPTATNTADLSTNAHTHAPILAPVSSTSPLLDAPTDVGASSTSPGAHASTHAAVTYKGLTVDIFKTKETILWAISWIRFSATLQNVRELFPCEPTRSTEDSLPEMDYGEVKRIPYMRVVEESGHGPWVVLRARQSVQLHSPAAPERLLHWLVKPSESGTIEPDSFGVCFSPAIDLVEQTIETIRILLGNSTREMAGYGLQGFFPKGRISLFRVGCWSRECRTIVSQSESTLRTHICARCRSARYCCRPCQRADWLRHREECTPWKEQIKKGK